LLAAVLLASLMLTVSGVRAAGQPFHPGVALLGVAVLICLAGPGAISMDRFMWGARGGTGRGAQPPR
jgi:hypothetical protein